MEEIIFVTQKVILRLLFPVCVVLFFGLCSLVLWRRRALSFLCMFIAVATLLVLSFPLTGLKLIDSIETKAGDYADPKTLVSRGARFIVVLSADFRDGDLTTADRLGSSLTRLMEGIRLWRQLPGAKLVVTGGQTPGLSHDMSIAQALSDMAVEMGVPKEAIVVEDKSWTTADQARLIKPLVGNEPFALVTSAYHLPRSLMLFRQQGMDPMPAPCDFHARKVYLGYETLVPQAGGLRLSQMAAKEYLATWWQRLRVLF